MAKSIRSPDNFELFPESLTGEQVQKIIELKALKHPVWSHQKARLIQLYLRFFVMVTHHGSYIDGFAGPQSPEHADSTWSAKLVLESRPRQLRHFFLCDLDRAKSEALKELWEGQPPREKKEAKRDCAIYCGDFNEKVDEILLSSCLTEKEATFALLDQRTFECHWATVQKLAAHKKSGNKIELFYFLAVKWLHRSLAGLSANEQSALDWWGNDGWRNLASKNQIAICQEMTARIKDELGYRWAVPYPICEREKGVGAVMYYMIHASDHPEAPKLMWRAYDQAIAPLERPEQGLLFGDSDG